MVKDSHSDDVKTHFYLGYLKLLGKNDWFLVPSENKCAYENIVG